MPCQHLKLFKNTNNKNQQTNARYITQVIIIFFFINICLLTNHSRAVSNHYFGERVICQLVG